MIRPLIKRLLCGAILSCRLDVAPFSSRTGSGARKSIPVVVQVLGSPHPDPNSIKGTTRALHFFRDADSQAPSRGTPSPSSSRSALPGAIRQAPTNRSTSGIPFPKNDEGHCQAHGFFHASRRKKSFMGLSTPFRSAAVTSPSSAGISLRATRVDSE